LGVTAATEVDDYQNDRRANPETRIIGCGEIERVILGLLFYTILYAIFSKCGVKMQNFDLKMV